MFYIYQNFSVHEFFIEAIESGASASRVNRFGQLIEVSENELGNSIIKHPDSRCDRQNRHQFNKCCFERWIYGFHANIFYWIGVDRGTNWNALMKRRAYQCSTQYPETLSATCSVRSCALCAPSSIYVSLFCSKLRSFSVTSATCSALSVVSRATFPPAPVPHRLCAVGTASISSLPLSALF